MASECGCANSFLSSLPNNQIQMTGALNAYQADTAMPASDLDRYVLSHGNLYLLP